MNGLDEKVFDALGRAGSSEIDGRDRRLVTSHLLDQRRPRDIRAAQLGDDGVERHRAAQQQGVAGMSGRLHAKALVLEDASHDGAEIRVGVHEQNPPALAGGARRRELVGHWRHTICLG